MENTHTHFRTIQSVKVEKNCCILQTRFDQILVYFSMVMHFYLKTLPLTACIYKGLFSLNHYSLLRYAVNITQISEILVNGWLMVYR